MSVAFASALDVGALRVQQLSMWQMAAEVIQLLATIMLRLHFAALDLLSTA